MEKTILNLTELSVYTGISKSYLYKLTHLGKDLLTAFWQTHFF